MSCIVLALFLGGCGDSDTAGGSGSAAPAPAPVTSGSALVGTWYRANPKTDLLGLEFTGDGKVLLYAPTGQTVTFDYAVMDGGRLRMNAPGGQTMIFACAVSDDALKLTPEGEAIIDESEFRRLPSGQTVRQALADETAQTQRRRDAVQATLRQYLQQPKLVLAADSTTRSSGIALDLKGDNGTFQGVAYFEGPDAPALRQVTVNILPISDDQPGRVQIAFGNVLGPIGQGPLPAQTETVALDESGGTPLLRGKALVLKSDPSAYDAILAGYQQIQQQRQAKIQQAIEPLGAYSRAAGEFAYPNNPGRSFKVNFGLLRGPGKTQFMLANLQNNANPAAGIFVQPAQVQLRGDEVWIVCPTLQISMQPKVGADGKLTLSGQYQSYNLPEVPVVQTFTEAQLDAIRARINDFINKQLPEGVALCGYMLKDAKADMPCPVTLSFKGNAPNVGGRIDVLHMDGAFELSAQPSETLTGVVLTYKSINVLKPGPSTLFGRSRNGTISLDFSTDQPTITGDLRGGFEVGPAILALQTPEALKAARDSFAKLLQTDADFACVDPQARRNQPPHFILKLDGDDKITGRVSQGYTHAINGPGTLTGTLSERDGMLVLDLQQPMSADKRIPASRHVLWVLRDQQGNTWLSGWTLSSNMNPPTVTSAKFLLSR